MPEFLKRLCSAFQSTLPYGSDLNAKSSLGFDNYISIHAPLRERQHPIILGLWDVLISIHAPLRERPSCASFRSRSTAFQSTLPCRSDLRRDVLSARYWKFQSTLPCGSDQPSLADQTYADISIHAPLRERLSNFLSYRDLSGISIHAPLRERQKRPYHSSRKRKISIHAPLRERQVSKRHNCIDEDFNPRSLAGATLG